MSCEISIAVEYLDDVNQVIMRCPKLSAYDISWPALDIPYKTSEKDGRQPGFKEQSFEWAEKWV